MEYEKASSSMPHAKRQFTSKEKERQYKLLLGTLYSY